MNFGKEFEKYAVKHKGISSNTLDGYMKHSVPNAIANIPSLSTNVGDVTNLTPNIIEERPMNVAVMDVYSRLMMDRIIFLGNLSVLQCDQMIQITSSPIFSENRPKSRQASF